MNKITMMNGGSSLYGAVSISGSKNSALPILAASTLCKDPIILKNIPKISDVSIQTNLMTDLGTKIYNLNGNSTEINLSILDKYTLSENAKSIRGSILFLGPILSRIGKIKLPFPGGCNIGTRNIDLHLSGLRKLGAEIYINDGYIYLETKRLLGAEISFPFPSVGATENILMASAMAEGETYIYNASVEPEVIDLENFLSEMGASIIGIGTPNLKIIGVEDLHGTNYAIIPDRVEIGTYIIACAIANGEIIIKNCGIDLGIFLKKVRDMGITIRQRGQAIQVIAEERPVPTDIITGPFPEFATDLQPLISALMTIADGTSTVTENIYDNRFSHVSELIKMGANIKTINNKLIINGVKNLNGTSVSLSDIRCGASLIIAGLNARGKTFLRNTEIIDRGYENMDLKLRKIGAYIF